MARMRNNKIRKLSVMDDYTPLPHQQAFHQSEAKFRAMVSGVGAGKTLMGVKECIKFSQLYPGSLGVIGRLTAKALKQTTQRRFFEICPEELIEDFNKTDSQLWLRTNERHHGAPIFSEILFMHLDEPGPLGSLDISYFYIDEVHEPEGGEVPEKTFQMLMARLRSEIGPHRGFLTSNSGGKDWVYRYFFEPKRKKRNKTLLEKFRAGELKVKPATWWGINVPTTVNPFLPEGYVEQLSENNPEHWVKRFLDGSFDVFEGQIFPEFDDSVGTYERPVLERHTYKDGEIEISPYTRKERGFDFGVSAPTTVVYSSIEEYDNVEHLIIYDEYYKSEADVDSVAKDIKRRGFDYVYADPSTQYRGPDKKSPADLYMSEGVLLMPSSNNENTFFSLLHKHLKNNTIHINKDRCPNLIEEIKSATWSPSTISGDTSKEKAKKSLKFPDHARDALKYLMLGLGAFKDNDTMNAVDPGAKSPDPNVIHKSYLEDEDYDPWAEVLEGVNYDIY